ncbi:MAG: indole-3-glycerol phosphate synthase TrpC [Flavobacteriales bacterium]|nr:MAG: indole-3-glycerol phosphate synthase TrpC [Flavobacteriales bacterium TMED96]RZP11161.1 MAG: indole-3-glycerol phosphate synthase TrpC [Flavobacteriales bacterium]|tara:strand:+ start:1205 stop:1996 length:792 start_codon:yes stop_codon:yes gene_type:complete
MSILKNIVIDIKKELRLKKSIIPISEYEKMSLFKRNTISMSDSIKKDNYGIIAEFKRRSPSKNEINNKLSVNDVCRNYQVFGASGLSVLTNLKHFGGSLEDLVLARSTCTLPILRKDFIIDEYQIYEAKAYGADIILLISSILTRDEIVNLSNKAKELKLEVLLEVHNTDELKKGLVENVDIIGVNNRNLKSFRTDLKISEKLFNEIPNEFLKISESGLNNDNSIKKLRKIGYQGFLIGEKFMASNDPGKELKKTLENLTYEN